MQASERDVSPSEVSDRMTRSNPIPRRRALLPLAVCLVPLLAGRAPAADLFNAAAGAAGGAGSAAQPGYVVIVNAACPVVSLPADEVARMFLHKTTLWPNGARVVAVDLPEDSPVRDSFSRTIHRRGVAAIKSYWQKMIFSGRDVPPAEKSGAEVLQLVRSDAGAIGYVAAGTPLGEGIRILKVGS